MKAKTVDTILRVTSLGFALIYLLPLRGTSDMGFIFITKIFGLGSFIPALMAADYHSRYYEETINGKENRYLKAKTYREYAQNTIVHVSYVLPIAVILLGPPNPIYGVLGIFYLISEKLFDEFQRYIQFAGNASVYSKFIFTRKHFL